MTKREPKQQKHRVFVLPGREEEIYVRAAAFLFRHYTQRGSTTNFTVSYDNTLGVNGQNMADAVLASCERDYATLQYYFGDITPARLPFKIFIDPGNGGASHATCSATEIHLDAFAATDGDLENMLNVAEVAEVFMANQGVGWDCGASSGEGLSRVLATEPYPAQLDNFASAASWLDSKREDFVTKNDGTDSNYVSIGCSTLFLNYLRYQLGFSWHQIVGRGAQTLARTYQNLTGRADAFPAFAALMQECFPEGAPAGLTDDNPFPLPRRIGVLEGTTLYVKEGPLDAAWTQEANCQSFALSGDRIGVLEGTTLYVKEGPLDAAWTQEANCQSFTLSS